MHRRLPPRRQRPEVALNRSLAKLASKLEKPDGLVLIAFNHIPDLEVEDNQSAP